MTPAELVEGLQAMRAALGELELRVLELDLAAKRASGDPVAAEVAAAHADDVRASLVAVAKRAAFCARLVARSQAEGG